MNQCECLEKCPFFNDRMKNMPSTARLIKKKYCETDSSTCARYIIFKEFGSEKVPEDMFPTQIERAKKFISEL